MKDLFLLIAALCIAVSLFFTGVLVKRTLAAPAASPDTCVATQVVDGDTVRLRCAVQPGLVAENIVWVRGFDAPELTGECAEERAQARAARTRLAQLLRDGVRSIHPGPDPYGRILATLVLPDGREVTTVLVQEGYGRLYSGGPRPDWCP